MNPKLWFVVDVEILMKWKWLYLVVEIVVMVVVLLVLRWHLQCRVCLKTLKRRAWSPALVECLIHHAGEIAEDRPVVLLVVVESCWAHPVAAVVVVELQLQQFQPQVLVIDLHRSIVRLAGHSYQSLWVVKLVVVVASRWMLLLVVQALLCVPS